MIPLFYRSSLRRIREMTIYLRESLLQAIHLQSISTTETYPESDSPAYAKFNGKSDLYSDRFKLDYNGISTYRLILLPETQAPGTLLPKRENDRISGQPRRWQPSGGMSGSASDTSPGAARRALSQTLDPCLRGRKNPARVLPDAPASESVPLAREEPASQKTPSAATPAPEDNSDSREEAGAIHSNIYNHWRETG